MRKIVVMADEEYATVVFEQGDLRVEVGRVDWFLMMQFLERRGWRPNIHWLNYLSGVPVPERDALSLSEAGESALDDALRDPLSFYPVPFDMRKFAELVGFAKGGSFCRCR
jgi:hypothetical protein